MNPLVKYVSNIISDIEILELKNNKLINEVDELIKELEEYRKTFNI
mgnify:CR=1 FL=1